MIITIHKYKKSDGTIPNYFDPALANQSQNPLIDKIIFNTYYKSGFSQYDEEFTQSDNLNIHKRSDFTVTFSLQQPERSTLGLRIDEFLNDTAKFVVAVDFDNKQLTGIINLDTVYTDYDTLEVQFNCVDWVVEFADYCKSIGVMQTNWVPLPGVNNLDFPHRPFSQFMSEQFRGNATYGSIPFHFIGVTNNLHLERAFGTDPIISTPLMWDICVAASISMEVLKWTIPYFKNVQSKYYPLWTLVICAIWVFLKTAVTGNFKDWLSNFIFTVFLTDVIYTYSGQYIIKWLQGLFQIKIGNVPSPKGEDLG